MLGPLAYAITGVRKLQDLAGTNARFEGPGFDLSCRFLAFAVGNTRQSGGGIAFTSWDSGEPIVPDVYTEHR